MNKKPIIITLVILVAGMFGIAYWAIEQAQSGLTALPELYEVTDFSFKTQDGEDFNRDNLKGNINIVDFIYTSCPGPCPIMTAKMSRLYQRYASTDLVQFVSISVDPNRDSVSVLKAYAQEHGVSDDRWQFLNGPIEEVIELYEGGFKLGGLLPVEHSTKFVLVDADAVIRGYYDSNDDISLSLLNTHARELAKELNDRK